MIIMNLSQTHSFMRKAIPLAKQMEGDWIVRMKIALNSVIINHYLNLPLTNENVNELLRKGVSYHVSIMVLEEKTLKNWGNHP